jgi:hypothetical protein
MIDGIVSYERNIVIIATDFVDIPSPGGYTEPEKQGTGSYFAKEETA